MINCVTGERGAQRGADTDRAADDPKPEIETPISASTTSQSFSWKRKWGSPPTMAEIIKEPSALHTRDPFLRKIGLLKSGTFANFHLGYNLSVSFSTGVDTFVETGGLLVTGD